MAKKFKCVECGVPKAVENDFYKTPTKLGHDKTCKRCRSEQNGELLRSRRDGTPRRKYVKKGQGSNQRGYKPTPERMAHEMWLIRAQNLFDRIFFQGVVDRLKCFGCKKQGKCGITGDYYDDYDFD